MQFKKNLLLASALITTITLNVFASLQTDVNGLTGGVQSKMVWVRATPSSTDKPPAAYYNAGTATTLMIYDSKETAPRVLDVGPSQHISPLIDRSGDWVIWNDMINQKSWIIKTNGTGKTALITNGNYYVLCTQWDDAAKKEYLWVTDSKETDANKIEEPFYGKVYKTLLNTTTGTTSGDTLIRDLGFNALNRAPFLVSGDGKLGGVNNWPNMSVWNFSKPEIISIAAVPPDDFRCWPNMAPDLSYRFFHFNQAHTALHMFDTYDAPATDVAKVRVIPIANKLPGNKKYAADGPNMDANGPRFSNNTRFISVSYPLTSDETYKAGEFCIGKFDATFTSASFVRITDTLDNYRDRIGDLWVASGEGPNKSTSISHVNQIKGSLIPFASVSTTTASINVSYAGNTPFKATLTSVNGQTIAKHSGAGKQTWSIPLESTQNGSYVLWISSNGQKFSKEVLVCK